MWDEELYKLKLKRDELMNAATEAAYEYSIRCKPFSKERDDASEVWKVLREAWRGQS